MIFCENLDKGGIFMVKGISKQVILVRPKEDALFDQAIFFVRDTAAELTEHRLLQEARLAMSGNLSGPRPWRSVFCFCGGAAATGLLWLLTVLL